VRCAKRRGRKTVERDLGFMDKNLEQTGLTALFEINISPHLHRPRQQETFDPKELQEKGKEQKVQKSSK
jgi:hypothetical protein